MDEKVASRRWSRGSSVAARATRSSAFLFVMDRNMQVFANADNIGAAHPRAVRTGDRVSRRPARTESNGDPPNGYTDTTRERQDAQKMAPVCVFFDVFMFSRRANVSAASRDGARRRDCRDWHFSRCAPLEGPRASKSAAGVGAGAALLSARRENVSTRRSSPSGALVSIEFRDTPRVGLPAAPTRSLRSTAPRTAGESATSAPTACCAGNRAG